MRCACGGNAPAVSEYRAGDQGIRRKRHCQACDRTFTTLEVEMPTKMGRDAARAQAAQVRGETFAPSKNLHTLKMEEHALSPEFLWQVLETYPCTVPNLVAATGLKPNAVDRRLRILRKEGRLKTIRHPKKQSRHGYVEYEMIPSHKRGTKDDLHGDDGSA